MKRILLSPLEDFMNAFQRVVPDPPWIPLGAVLVGFAVGWWIYVPIHELLHAFGCLVTGGSVDRLEIDPQYGAALLQKIFPFVAVGSDYAGQLTGFDTHGNDLIYLATDLAPFLLTIFVGVPVLRALTRTENPGLLQSLLLGVSLPVALAPFINLNGDYYEMGSIVVSRVASLFSAEFSLDRWRSDDLAKTANELLFQGAFRFSDLAGLTLGALLGVVLAFATYWAGRLLADRLSARRPAE